jgi:hypothetical protein
LPARQHRAGGLRIHRHSGHHAAGHHWSQARTAQRHGRTIVRAAVADFAGLPGAGHERTQRVAWSLARGRRLRPRLRLCSTHGLKPARSPAHRHPQFARLDWRVDRGVEALAASGHILLARQQRRRDGTPATLRYGSVSGLAPLPSTRALRAHLGQRRRQAVAGAPDRALPLAAAAQRHTAARARPARSHVS